MPFGSVRFHVSSHDFGYDVSNYCDINPEYGNLNDFDQLMKQHTDLDYAL